MSEIYSRAFDFLLGRKPLPETFAQTVCEMTVFAQRERDRMFPVLLDIYRHHTRGHNAFKIWFDKEFMPEVAGSDATNVIPSNSQELGNVTTDAA